MYFYVLLCTIMYNYVQLCIFTNFYALLCFPCLASYVAGRVRTKDEGRGCRATRSSLCSGQSPTTMTAL